MYILLRVIPCHASHLFVYGIQNLSKKVQDTLAKANEVAEETCSSMRTVRSFANEKAEAERYASRLMDTYRLKVKEAMAYAGFMWCTDVSRAELRTHLCRHCPFFRLKSFHLID